MDDETVRRYLRIYQEEGVKGLMRDLYQGSLPRLNKAQIKNLEKYLDEHVCLGANGVYDYVWNEFGIWYSESGITALLHLLGYVYKKPKLTPGKAEK